MATEITNLENPQQIEAAISGPSGATRLFVCTGIAPIKQEVTAGSKTTVWTWHLGPQLGEGQFRRAIVTGALVRVSHTGDARWSLEALDADLDDEAGRVEVRAEVLVSAPGADNSAAVSGISYQVSILAALGPEPGAGPSPTAGAVALTATPPTLDLGTHYIGNPAPAPRPITVTNTGTTQTGPVQVSLVGQDPGQFTIVNNPLSGASLPPGGSGVVTVQFRPTSTGLKRATLQVQAQGGVQVTVPLSGTAGII